LINKVNCYISAIEFLNANNYSETSRISNDYIMLFSETSREWMPFDIGSYEHAVYEVQRPAL